VRRYVRYQSGGGSRYGELSGTSIHPLDGAFAQFLPSRDASTQLEDTKLLAPSEPTKIISIGPNFTRLPDLSEPMIWCHPVTCANEPEGIVEMPPGNPAINHESELGIVIGRPAKMVSPEKAGDYIFGFTCFNDITAGDFYLPMRQMRQHRTGARPLWETQRGRDGLEYVCDLSKVGLLKLAQAPNSVSQSCR
jgi:2-keto-4-pentenoate hydratase/2-oxohepta-3-ene-1,7-dioic acid hydratase in catechol pathway